MQFSALAAARTPRLRPYVALQALAAFSLALGLGLELQRHLRFEYHASSGIVGWLSVHEYPKQQELLYFLLALIGLPLVMTLYWLAWMQYGALAAARTGQPVERFLRLSALASLPLLLVWRGSYRPEESWTTMLGLPIGLTLAAVLAGHRLLRVRPLAAPLPAAPEPPVQAMSALPRERVSRLRRLLRCGLEYLALPIVVYVIAHSGNIHGRIDLFHEGERLGPLNLLLRGGIPFRDVYVQHGLFQDAYLARLGSAVFSPTLEGVRAMQRLLEPLGYVALYLLGLQVFRGGAATALLLSVLASGVNIGVSGRNTLGLVALALTASYVTRQQRGREGAGEAGGSSGKSVGLGRLLGAGVTTSLAFWYSTEVGLYTLAAIGLYLVVYGVAASGSARERSSPLVAYCGGVSIGLAGVGLYFAFHGALGDALTNTYIQCATQMDVWGRAFPSLSSILTPLTDMGVLAGWRSFVLSEGFRWYLPVFVLVVAGGTLTYRCFCGDLWQSQGCVQLFLLWLASAVFFRTALGRSDNIHMDFGATTAWMLLLFFVDRGVGRLVDELRSADVLSKTRWKRALVASWILVPALALLWYAREVHLPGPERGGERKSRLSSLLDGRLFEPATKPTALERAGKIDIPAEQEEQIRDVVTYIRQQTAADEAIFDFSNQGALYFFADRPNATRFSQAVYASTPALQQEVIAALERQQTRLVIFKSGSYADRFDGVPTEKRLPLIARYLAERYEPAATIQGTELLRRRQ